MRVGIVCYPSIGGSGMVATELAIDLAARGHEVHIISFATPFRLRRFMHNITFHPAEHIDYPLFNQSLATFALTAKIIEVVEAYDLEVIHAHYSVPHSICAHLAREISKRRFGIVTTLHGTDVTIVGRDKPLYPLNRYGIEQSDIVTTVSDFQRRFTLEEFRLDKDIRVVHNFIDTDVFNPDAADPGGRACLADGDEKIVMHISNFREVKNVEGVIRAFAHAAGQVDVRLALIGDGPDLVKIRNTCRELSLCDRIAYVGTMDNPETILPLADCVLQPSYRESFGMVLLEAMACGVPTVSSNVDGIPEVVAHGETGFMAGPDDHEALGEYIVQLCRDAGLRQRLGRQGRDRASRLFRKDLIVPQYLQCYDDSRKSR